MHNAESRALPWGSLWDAVREAELAPAEFLRLTTEHAPRERDDVALQFVLARALTAYTRYLSDEQRAAVGPGFERMLRSGLTKAGTAGERLTYLRAYRDAVETKESFDFLAASVTDRGRQARLNLGPRDRFDLVRALIAAGDERGPGLLEELRAEADTNDARRYAYAAGAAWPDAATKQNYFRQYLSDRELPESWVETSLASFNSARQGPLTFPYLGPALRELPNLKLTRKIFFVNAWLTAFVGGRCDARSLSTVRDYLARGPLDRDLRLKVMEAADGLERCVRVRAKFAGDVSRAAAEDAGAS